MLRRQSTKRAGHKQTFVCEIGQGDKYKLGDYREKKKKTSCYRERKDCAYFF